MIEAWFDGACWPNPGGPSGAGALIRSDGEIIFSHSEFIPEGNTSNNIAEYCGLLLILRYLTYNWIEEPVLIYGDSLMVVKQMSGEWRIKEPTATKPRLYVPFAREAVRLNRALPKLDTKFQWIPRAENSEADALSTQPLVDRGLRDPYKK